MTNPPSKNVRHQNTSWQPVSEWYTKTVGESGNYYHQHVVIPAVLQLLNLSENSSLLDLACGQGVLERQISPSVYYQGIDISPSLINYAKTQIHNPNHHVAVGNVTRPLPIAKTNFSHAAIVLALQNIEEPELALQQAADRLAPNGTLVLMLNHPAFRIPRQSSWGIDEKTKTQFRRVDRYLSPLKIPITAAPGQGQRSAITWSYHQPISAYSAFLNNAGFVIEIIEELGSDKVSVGKAAKMENRSRVEFPLFMAIKAQKVSTTVE
ncbi:TPA: methyltransferase domain-containing protein [Candidatus Woesearchaeota archaeon]|nr:methyltransferase domain-containing protein [Candidatus Woesearchaeota archaeon]